MATTPAPAATTSEPTTAQRKFFAKMGLAMPDGSFYIRSGSVGASDLDNAIRAVGRGEADGGNGNDIRRHIMKRAAALKLTNKIPDTWNSDGSLKHDLMNKTDAYLAQFGVKGMHWGVRSDGSSGSSHISPDAARSNELKATVKKHGVSALSNKDLQHLVTRQNLERQHSNLNASQVNTGHALVKKMLLDSGKQEAQKLVAKHAAKGAEWLATQAVKQLLGTKAGSGRHA